MSRLLFFSSLILLASAITLPQNSLVNEKNDRFIEAVPHDAGNPVPELTVLSPSEAGEDVIALTLTKSSITAAEKSDLLDLLVEHHAEFGFTPLFLRRHRNSEMRARTREQAILSADSASAQEESATEKIQEQPNQSFQTIKNSPVDSSKLAESSHSFRNSMKPSSLLKETSSEPMHNFKNSQYTAEITIGTPPQSFSMILDTGSANLFIDSSKCLMATCTQHAQFQCDLSETCQESNKMLEVEFGSGSINGEMIMDTLVFDSLPIENQHIAAITKTDSGIFEMADFDGIVGLSFPSLAAYNYSPVMDSIINGKLLKHNVFSFYYSRKNDGLDSRFILGGYDSSLMASEVHYHKVIKEYYWQVKVDQILVNGVANTMICPMGGCKAIADTGTTLISAPSRALGTLLNELNIDYDCSNYAELPTLTYSL